MNRIIVYMAILWLLQACAASDPEPATSPVAKEKNSISLTAAQIQKAQIRTSLLEQKTIHQEITVNGVVDVPPQNMVSVSFPPSCSQVCVSAKAR
jgi:cobalt-zinc-cadmium efflux system membrane fusion protein